MDKPEGAGVYNFTVRAYSIEKGYDQCNKLTSCYKDLRKRFKEFYKSIKKMQVEYKKQVV